MIGRPSIFWTEKGRQFAEHWASTQVVEEQLFKELEEEGGDPDTFIFHVVELAGGDDRIFIAQAGMLDGKSTIRIDAAFWEDDPELTEGPFKGKRFRMPVPVTDDDDDD